jgi:hypothetical protein
LRKVLSRLEDDKPVMEELLLDEPVELAAVVALLAVRPATGAVIAGLIP